MFRECPGSVPGVSRECPGRPQRIPKGTLRTGTDSFAGLGLHREGIHEISDGKQPLCLRIQLKSHPPSDFYLVSQMLNLSTARQSA